MGVLVRYFLGIPCDYCRVLCETYASTQLCQRAILLSAIYTGVFSMAVGFTLQVMAQKHTLPGDTALILSTESAFAAFFWLAFCRRGLAPGAIGRLRVDPGRCDPGPGQRISFPHNRAIIKLIYFILLSVLICCNDRKGDS